MINAFAWYTILIHEVGILRNPIFKDSNHFIHPFPRNVCIKMLHDISKSFKYFRKTLFRFQIQHIGHILVYDRPDEKLVNREVSIDLMWLKMIRYSTL